MKRRRCILWGVRGLGDCGIKHALDSCFSSLSRGFMNSMSARAALLLLTFTLDVPQEKWFPHFRATGRDAGRYRNWNWAPVLRYL